jgi:hypothetical protein
MNKRFLYLLIAIPFVVSCGSSSSDETEIPDSVKNKIAVASGDVDKSVINDLVQNVSSPIEMAALIKKEGVSFSKDYLSDADNVDKFNTAFEKAINLGVYGADLGYMNIYDKTSLIINHITSIKKIAEDLKIGQFFDFSTLKRLASNNENLDSLMYISTSSFNKMDDYLRQNKRGDLSTLMITGVWIEGLYLATQVTLKSKNIEIQNRVGEQKVSLENLMLILKLYEKDNNFAELIKEFNKIKAVYEPVTITVEKGEPTTEEVDGSLMIVQHDKQRVTMPDGHMAKIISVIKEVRNKVIGIQK